MTTSCKGRARLAIALLSRWSVPNCSCAALRNKDTVSYAVYRKGKEGKFEKYEQEEETVEYYGGSDACQGDSGGPL